MTVKMEVMNLDVMSVVKLMSFDAGMGDVFLNQPFVMRITTVETEATKRLAELCAVAGAPQNSTDAPPIVVFHCKMCAMVKQTALTTLTKLGA